MRHTYDQSSVRLVVTNDFFGHYGPERTSYGFLPGAEGLRHAVEKLREGRPTVWADAGDFSGGPLAVVSGGALGFEAASELGIDVAAAGNHEFDWGAGHLREQVPKLGFPLLCANADVGMPETAVVPTAEGDVGFIGLTTSGTSLRPRFGVGTDADPAEADPAETEPKADAELTQTVMGASARLRREGSDFVVALLHDGVYVSRDFTGGLAVDPSRFVALCRPWAREVDAIVAGHTIVTRWFGRVDDTPVLQPWAFGAEVGVLELAHGKKPRFYGVPVEPAGRWTGRGCEVLDRLEGQVIGQLHLPLTFPVVGNKGSGDLLDFAARALRVATGADAAAVMAWTGGLSSTQPPVDGVECFLPEGPIAEADLLRLVPWPDDATVLVELTTKELEDLAARSPVPWRCSVAGGGGTCSRRALTVAMTAYMAREAGEWVGRGLPVRKRRTRAARSLAGGPTWQPDC